MTQTSTRIQQILEPSTLTKTITQLKKEGKSIGLVPTMGALHLGHMSLIKKALEENDVVVCSIFVNPTQFNNKEDLKKYPNTLQQDLFLLEENGCHIAFTPNISSIYPNGETLISIDYGTLDKTMEGPFRPGHFDGVVTIVSKLFTIAQPNTAYFGEKDYQQLAIIQSMNQQLNFSTIIRPCAIVRANSGLAMSSRNSRLSEKGKKQAAELYACLQQAKEKAKAYDISTLKKWVANYFKQRPYFTLEYFEIANAHDLSLSNNWESSAHIRGFIVAHLEGVRLIDNIALIKDQDAPLGT